MNSFEHLDAYTEDKRFPKSFINDPKQRADGKKKNVINSTHSPT